MYRIRFHGRGGQGMKTAGRILGNAFFNAGFEVQDAPRYGAERRGAPIFSYVRADRKKINERGVIHSPDIAVIADDTLLTVAKDSVIEGVTENSTLLVITLKNTAELSDLLQIKCRLISVSENLLRTGSTAQGKHSLSILCTTAAAQLTGEITVTQLEEGIKLELASLPDGELSGNLESARNIFHNLEKYHATAGKTGITESVQAKDPHWIELSLQDIRISTATIYKTKTTINNPTGTWRTFRPVIIGEKCSKCLLCYVSCPDSAINLTEERYPEIDYGHCKGCLLCTEVCPVKAISIEPEDKSIEGGMP